MGSLGLQEEPAGQKALPLQKFKLYETFSHFYMIGRGKNKTLWKVLKIERMSASELNIYEDAATYSSQQCSQLLRTIHEGHRSMGGIRLLTICYGIAGFIKFQEPYYMLLITQRKKIGSILGEKIYGISKTMMIPIPNPTVRSKNAYSTKENRYKKLLNTVDLTKDFFFSYSYHIMCSLQKNLSDYTATGPFLYETMFVWNEFLTRQVRKKLKNTLWTVALVYGFFKQIKLGVYGNNFKFTLIARRSRYYAGTRFLRRGVNEQGKVANDVETEQIVSEDVPEDQPLKISSVVQNRGSIPLHWSQETSLLKIFKPVIMLPKQGNYEATKLHFKNLVYRYGNPIIILDLTKTQEKKPRETILRAEYANAIGCINTEYLEKERLNFLQWDLHQHSRSKSSVVLAQLRKLTEVALKLTGIFCCQLIPSSGSDSTEKKDVGSGNLFENRTDKIESDYEQEIREIKSENEDVKGKFRFRHKMVQDGVLRTNCIDCLDRTNIAQYAFGLAALGQQLGALEYLESAELDVENPLAKEIMGVYEKMGDKLSLQYGGSAAHNKIFCERRGQWKPAIEYLDFIKTVQRFVNNAYMDSEKQNAIDVFLGNPFPQSRKLEFDPDQHSNYWRTSLRRSLSDSSILWESDNGDEQPSLAKSKGANSSRLVDLMPEISTYCRYTSPDFSDVDSRSESTNSNDEIMSKRESSLRFLDVDWFSESVYSREDEIIERIITAEPSNNEIEDNSGFDFGRWVADGGSIFR